MEGPTYEMEQLHTEVTSLCGRIELIPCATAKDRLAQSGGSGVAGLSAPVLKWGRSRLPD